MQVQVSACCVLAESCVLLPSCNWKNGRSARKITDIVHMITYDQNMSLIFGHKSFSCFCFLLIFNKFLVVPEYAMSDAVVPSEQMHQVSRQPTWNWLKIRQHCSLHTHTHTRNMNFTCEDEPASDKTDETTGYLAVSSDCVFDPLSLVILDRSSFRSHWSSLQWGRRSPHVTLMV